MRAPRPAVGPGGRIRLTIGRSAALVVLAAGVAVGASGCVGYDQGWKSDYNVNETDTTTTNWQWTEDYVRDQRLKQQQLDNR